MQKEKVVEAVKPEYQIGDEVIWTTTGATVEILDIFQFKNQVRYNIEVKGKDYYVPGSELEPLEDIDDEELSADDAKRMK